MEVDMTKAEYLETLEGREIRSIQFESLVSVTGGKVKIDYTGKVITPTKAQAKELFQEALEQEFGTRNLRALLEEEFV